MVRVKDKRFVSRLNNAARNGRYRPELPREFAGAPLDTVWVEFLDSLRKR